MTTLTPEQQAIDQNLRFYKAMEDPPMWALKEIKGGRLSGKTDIRPQWRIEKMTQMFGPIGMGWKIVPVERWTEPGSEGQVMCFVRLAVHYKIGDAWSEPVYGIGGNMLVEKERAGMHTNDEGWKMAETDAISTALKFLGVAAKIYAGLKGGGGEDRTKYDARTPEGRNGPLSNGRHGGSGTAEPRKASGQAAAPATQEPDEIPMENLDKLKADIRTYAAFLGEEQANKAAKFLAGKKTTPANLVECLARLKVLYQEQQAAIKKDLKHENSKADPTAGMSREELIFECKEAVGYLNDPKRTAQVEKWAQKATEKALREGLTKLKAELDEIDNQAKKGLSA